MKVHDIPKLNFPVRSSCFTATVWGFQRDPRPVPGPSPLAGSYRKTGAVALFPPSPRAPSALSEVGEALGCREGVGLQGEEVLLRRQEEASVLRGVGGLMELQLGL